MPSRAAEIAAANTKRMCGILRACSLGAPAAVCQDETGFVRRLADRRFRVERVAWQKQHLRAVLFDKQRLAPMDRPALRPRDCLIDRLERLELAQRRPGGRRQDDLVAAAAFERVV